jgi:hypothetical protein
VQYLDRREEVIGHAGELIPMKERPLASPFQRFQPAPANLSHEPPHAFVVARQVEMPFEHPFHPRSGLGDGVMHTFSQLHLGGLQLSQNPLLDRLAPDDERTPLAVVREAEEVEGLRLPLSRTRYTQGLRSTEQAPETSSHGRATTVLWS